VLVNYVDPDQPLCWVPQLQQEFCLTDGELGWPFSEFFWSYALMQIPTGMILDRFGVRKVYRVSAFLWSFTSAATASAMSTLTWLLLSYKVPAEPASKRVALWRRLKGRYYRDGW